MLAAADTTDGELSVAGSVDTPTETISIDEFNSEYDVNSYATVRSDESLGVDVTASEDEEFDVYLYDSDKQIPDDSNVTGSGSITFDMDSREPGTYLLMLAEGNNYIDIHPVVVNGYDVTIETPNDVSPDDETVSVTADITPTALEDDPAGAEIAVWNDDEVIRETAEETDDGQYEAVFSSNVFEDGSYSVSAVAHGDETIDGNPEPLGISDTGSLSVSDSQNDDSDSDDGVDDSDSDDESESDAADDSADDSDADGTDSESDESADTDDANDSDDDTSGVQQPNLEDDDDTETDPETDDSDSVPIFAVSILTAIAVLVGLVTRVYQ